MTPETEATNYRRRKKRGFCQPNEPAHVFQPSVFPSERERMPLNGKNTHVDEISPLKMVNT